MRLMPTPRRYILPLASLLTAILLVGCGGESSPNTAVADVRTEVVTFDVALSRDSGEAPDSAVDTSTDVPPAVECVVDTDCSGHFPRARACERQRCDSEGRCVIEPKTDGAPCDDGNECTVPDACQSGECVSGAQVCDCLTDLDCAPFDDEDICNGVLHCDVSSVPYRCDIDRSTIVSCDLSHDTLCHETHCVPESGDCVTVPTHEGESCNDSDPCTGSTVCNADGECVGEFVCQCRDDLDCLDYEDGDQCNGTLFCDLENVPYVCRVRAGSEVVCDGSQNSECVKNRCQPESGACQRVNEPDGTPCQDHNGCTEDDACLAGTCVPGTTKDCDDHNACTNDGCNPQTGQCTHVFNSMPCDDVYACSQNDICREGTCARGTTVVCDDDDPCTEDTCVEPTGCVFTWSAALCPPPADVVQPDEDVIEPPADITEPPADIVASPDVAPSDVLSADISLDDVWAPSDRGLFRVDSLGWISPEPCFQYFPPPEPCVPAVSPVSQAMQDRIDDADAPLVLLLSLEPLDLWAPEADGRFGLGDCSGGGDVAETCAFDSPDDAALYTDVIYEPEGTCGSAPSLDAPCFATGEGDDLALPLFPASLPLLHTSIRGRLIPSFDGVEDGVLRGFLTETAAADVSFTLPGYGEKTLAEVLANTPTSEVDSASGWWVELGWTARPVQ